MDSNSGIIYTFTNNNHHQQQQQQQQIPQSINNINNIDSNTSVINPFLLIEHLQQKVKQEENLRLELEKELSTAKAQISDLQNQLQDYENSLQKNQELQRVQLETIKKRLLNTISKSSLSSIDYSNQNQTSSFKKSDSLVRKIEFLHECDECDYKTKSNVSLILHKMNHKLVETKYLLSSQSFTTRDSNSKAIYKCASCGLENLTRHEVYRHIYENHTLEKPLSCPYCELSFTHNDYLQHHVNVKHVNEKYSRKKLSYNNSESSPSFLERLKIRRAHGGRKQLSKFSNKDLKCTFPDCNFVTIFPEKLDFHMEAHVNTKFKCPYCPYVSNTLIDIKRHIQKSKKHIGLKVYSCQKCSFAADCDRTFKDHLKNIHFGQEVPDATIDYFIEEMFSNKNKRNQDEDNELINLENNKAIASISKSTDTNNFQSSNTCTLTTTIVPSTQTTSIKRLSVNDDNQDTILLSSLPKKMSLSKRLLNLNNQPQPTSHNQSIEQTTIENQKHQLLSLHSASNQNEFQNLQLTTTISPALISDSDAISFVTQQQQPNITSISDSTMTITGHHSASTQHHLHNHNHHHHHVHHNNQQQQLSQNTISLLSMQGNFVQTALNQASLVVQQQQPQQINSIQQNTPNNQNNVIENSIDPINLNEIPASLAAQYISYANY